jgi:hypothetical protein
MRHACLASGGLLSSSILRRDVRSEDQVDRGIAGCFRAVHTCSMLAGMHFVQWLYFCLSRAISECLPCLMTFAFELTGSVKIQRGFASRDGNGPTIIALSLCGVLINVKQETIWPFDKALHNRHFLRTCWVLIVSTMAAEFAEIYRKRPALRTVTSTTRERVPDDPAMNS